jgi:creatinine amidohydrolase
LADVSSSGFALAVPANPIIMLPLGSHEDHGPHLPMGDYELLEILALKIAEDCAARGVPAFVAPTLPFGVADYFGSSAGGLAVSSATFSSLLGDLIGGLRRHGLTRIIILNGHGGNTQSIHDVTLNIKLAGGPVIPSLYIWKMARILMERRLKPSDAHRFGHGAEPLLSLSLALRPETTGAECSKNSSQNTCCGLPVSGFGTVDFEGLPIDMPVEFDQVPQDAIARAKSAASVELGASITNELIGLAARFAVHFASQQLPA